MNKKLSEPVTLIALGALVLLLGVLARGTDPWAANGLMTFGLGMIGGGGAWWLVKAHVRELQEKRQKESVGS